MNRFNNLLHRGMAALPISFVVALCSVMVTARPLYAQSDADTLRYGLFKTSRSAPFNFVPGQYVQQVFEVRTGPDSAPASTATADSVVLSPSALVGYSYQFHITGTASASNAKSVVITFTAAGATTTIDSLQMKTGGGRWVSNCFLTVRNATSGAATGDSAQVLFCTHGNSADSSTTSTAAPLTSTVKMVANGTGNALKVHNATGTAKGDVVVTSIIVEALPGGRVNQ